MRELIVNMCFFLKCALHKVESIKKLLCDSMKMSLCNFGAHHQTFNSRQNGHAVLTQYLQFGPWVKHSGLYYVLLMNQRLEVCVEACAQGLVEVSVVGDTALQGLIQVNEGWYDGRDGHTISLQDLG